MLTPNQEKYLLTIPEDKIIIIQPFDPKVKEVADEMIKKIQKELPDLEVSFGGASALGIAGQNDIDINLLAVPEEYNKYLPALISLFGEPSKQSDTLIKWQFVKDGFETELYLTDRNSSTLQEQIRTFEILKNSPELRQEYQQLKVFSNGIPFREYMRRKYEFFNKVLSI